MTRTPAARVGIDLGTTNTVLAFADAGSEHVATFAIPQLVAPGEVDTAPLLPSSRYHPLDGELAEDANHHPDIDIRYTKISFHLSTHSAGGITPLDLKLAATIDAAAAGAS